MFSYNCSDVIECLTYKSVGYDVIALQVNFNSTSVY